MFGNYVQSNVHYLKQISTVFKSFLCLAVHFVACQSSVDHFFYIVFCPFNVPFTISLKQRFPTFPALSSCLPSRPQCYCPSPQQFTHTRTDTPQLVLMHFLDPLFFTSLDLLNNLLCGAGRQWKGAV